PDDLKAGVHLIGRVVVRIVGVEIVHIVLGGRIASLDRGAKARDHGSHGIVALGEDLGQGLLIGVGVDRADVDGVPPADRKIGTGQFQSLLVGVVKVFAQVNRTAVLKFKGIDVQAQDLVVRPQI